MFASFRQGADTNDQGWDDTPAYVSGRFHAHALPLSGSNPLDQTSSNTGATPGPGPSTAASGASSPLLRALSPVPRVQRGISSNPSPFESALTTPIPAAAPLKRGVSRRPKTERGTPQYSRDIQFPSISESPARRDVPSNGKSAPNHDYRTRSNSGRSRRISHATISEPNERSWLLRPGRERVESWLETWWRRWAVLVVIPCCFVWVWCAVPFPVSDPYVDKPPWKLPWPSPSSNTSPSAFLHQAPSAAVASATFVSMPSTSAMLSVPQFLARHYSSKTLSIHPSTEQLRSSISLTSDNSFALPTAKPLSARLPSRLKPQIPQKEEPDETVLPVDANFYFFLFVYYGIYLAVALIWVTKLFDLYRLNWWPTSLGGSISYFFFWTLSLLVGFLLHYFDLDGLGRRQRKHHPAGRHKSRDGDDWERKTVWVALAFATMTLPALACFAKLRADRRQSYRRSLTTAQATFLERQLTTRMPRSFKRFLWFILAIILSLLALIVGQAYATVYLASLPHKNVDGLVYVWTWIVTVQCLNAVSNWVLERKVRSRALGFVFKFYYFLVYHIFYRNLFARLRSPDQALFIQLLSSSWVIIWYPLSMSKAYHRLLKWAVGFETDWEVHKEQVGISKNQTAPSTILHYLIHELMLFCMTVLYLRNLSENVTMVAFLGWLTILHYGPNAQLYPFFSFESSSDPYNYKLTAVASLIIWATELVSSFLARTVIWWAYEVDVTNLGLDEFREHPELVVACVWASIHVLMDILLFLIKLNFR